jgi:hypothetical protein
MRNRWIGLTVFVCVFSLTGCNGTRITLSQKGPEGWIPLLKGDTLENWYPYIKGQGVNQDPDGIFTIHNGVLHIYDSAADGSKMPYGYLATVKEYENYRLRLQFKWGTKRFVPRADKPRDSGLLYHFIGDDKVWPLSTECQIMEGDTGSIIPVGTTVTTTLDPVTGKYKNPAVGGIECILNDRITMNRDWEAPGWNTVEIIVRNDNAVHIINGHVNNQCTHIWQPDPQNPERLIHLSRGKILLQAEGAEIFYRNVEIKYLQP